MTARSLLLAAWFMLLFLQVSIGGQGRSFDAAEQQEVIRATVDLIEARYVEVTALLHSLSGDGHLGLSYSHDPIPEERGELAFSATEMERWYGPQINHG